MMDSLKIAIYSVDKKVNDNLEKVIYKYYDELQIKVEVHVYTEEECFLKDCRFLDFFLLFIDIDKNSGVKAMIEYRKMVEHIAIIIVMSKNENYQVEFFALHIFDYLSKPIETNKVIKVLGKIIAYFPKTRGRSAITVKDVKGNVITLNCYEIIYCECDKVKSNVHIITKDKDIEVNDTLMNVYSSLSECDFVYSHKSVIINLEHVKALGTYRDIEMDNGEILQASQSKTPNVTQMYKAFCIRKAGKILGGG